MKKLLIIISLIFQQSYSQTADDNYELYSLILSEKLELGTTKKIDSILLIKRFENRLGNDYSLFELSSDSITSNDINILLIKTNKDTTFVKRLIQEPSIKRLITGLTDNIDDNPKIEINRLKPTNLHTQSISTRKYYSFFGRNFDKKNPWERIERKFGTRKVVELSRVNYSGNLAAVYYGLHCGSLCGTGNIVIFEKIDEKWRILTELNLWMS
ncbi:hypothetical protein LA313_03320 [Salinimicrobium sp. ASW11-47]|nr:hypothetical protein [Salinimicrobium sediminilitoris]